jgi:hypothetical protein
MQSVWLKGATRRPRTNGVYLISNRLLKLAIAVAMSCRLATIGTDGSLAENQNRSEGTIPRHRVREGPDRRCRPLPRQTGRQGAGLHGQGRQGLVKDCFQPDQEAARYRGQPEIQTNQADQESESDMGRALVRRRRGIPGPHLGRAAPAEFVQRPDKKSAWELGAFSSHERVLPILIGNSIQVAWDHLELQGRSTTARSPVGRDDRGSNDP